MENAVIEAPKTEVTSTDIFDRLDDIWNEGKRCLWDDFCRLAGSGETLPEFISVEQARAITQEIPGHNFECDEKKVKHFCGRAGCKLTITCAMMQDGRLGVFPQGKCQKRGEKVV